MLECASLACSGEVNLTYRASGPDRHARARRRSQGRARPTTRPRAGRPGKRAIEPGGWQVGSGSDPIDRPAFAGPQRRLDPEAYRHCFGCGPDNPIGLHLHFEPTGDGVAAAYVPSAEHQGWDGIVHGGIVATILDEALAYAAYYAAGPSVTAELQVRLRRPCLVGATLAAEGRIVFARRRLLRGEARLIGERGEVIAEARGTLVLKDGDSSGGRDGSDAPTEAERPPGTKE
jgi:uncharacterized protein (TIGR00369 family)